MNSLDIIIPLKSSLTDFAIQYTIPSVMKHLEYKTLFIITKTDNIPILKEAFGDKIQCLDEDKSFKNLSFNDVKSYMQYCGTSGERTGWYFQQFLKLSLAQMHYISEYYLIWDADAVCLNKLSFFSEEGQVYFDKTSEEHTPYFDLNQKLFNLSKQVNFSFIAEHFIFKKTIVNTIISNLPKTNQKLWWQQILNHIKPEHLENSGFSEYELYGNYVLKHHPNLYTYRPLNKLRKAKSFLGMEPSDKDLRLFSKLFDYISFEEWHKTYSPYIYRKLKISLLFMKKRLE